MCGLAMNQMAIRDVLQPHQCLTIEALDCELNEIKRTQIVKAVTALITRGYAERVEIGCYQLTKAGVLSAEKGEIIPSGPTRKHTAKARKRVPDTLRQRAWTAMRLSGTFTIPDLLMIAQRPENSDAENGLQTYCKLLTTTGYLLEFAIRAEGTKPGSPGFKRFRLINDTGDFAPVHQLRKKRLFDHNTQEGVSCR